MTQEDVQSRLDALTMLVKRSFVDKLSFADDDIVVAAFRTYTNRRWHVSINLNCKTRQEFRPGGAQAVWCMVFVLGLNLCCLSSRRGPLFSG